MAGEAVAKLSFDAHDAERQLSDLERRLDDLARKALNIPITFDQSEGMGGGTSAPGAAPAALGATVGLDDVVKTLREILAATQGGGGGSGGGGGGGSGGGGGGGKSLWRDDDISEYKKQNTKGPDIGRGVGAVTGALTSLAGSSNPIAGIASAGAAIVGAVGGPIAGAIAGGISSIVSMLAAGAQEAVQVGLAASKTLRSEQIRTGNAGTSRAIANRFSEVAANGGWSNEEAAQMLASEQQASGLFSSIGGEIGTLKMAGVSEKSFGRFRGASAQYGGHVGGSYEGKRLAGMAAGIGLDPNTILDAVTRQRSALAPFGSGDDGSGIQRDFMERVYSTEEGRSSGRGAAEVITGVAHGNVSRRNRFLDPVKSFAATLDDIAAYQKAGQSGARGMFEYSAELADAATNETAEEKALNYKSFGLSDKEAGIMLAASTGQSFAAGGAVAKAAGDFSIETMDFAAPNADAASMSAAHLEILVASAKQDSANLAISTDHLSEIKGMIALAGAWGRGKREVGISTVGAIAAGLTGE